MINMPPKSMYLSSWARRSISRIVVLDRPNVLAMSIIRRWAPLIVFLWSLRFSKIPLPDFNISSTPLFAFCKRILQKYNKYNEREEIKQNTFQTNAFLKKTCWLPFSFRRICLLKCVRFKKNRHFFIKINSYY